MSFLRNEWSALALKLSLPILEPLAQGKLKTVFFDNSPTTCLEAFARVLLGLAYWIESGINEEEVEPIYLGELARKALDSATNKSSQDYMNFSCHEQCLVEGALLAQALIRAPTQLWNKLPVHVKNNIINSLKATRTFEPHDNNWVLFPSMIETFFLSIGEHVRNDRLMIGINQYMKWYCGDGMYMDGEEFHFDYYNSFVIQPMLTDILDIVVSKIDIELAPFIEKHNKRFQRLGVILERLIAPDGTFPPVGRSITYRCGAFHALAVGAYKNNLSAKLQPSQVRVALGKVIQATLGHPDTFENGFLTIGLYGKQPNLAESYINNGSLYLCSTIFAPLGLPPDAPFWNDPDDLTTWELLKQGYNCKRDKPYTECIRNRGKCV